MLFNSQRRSQGSSSPNSTTDDSSTISHNPTNYRASVPICIYREIVQDWETAKAELESLKDKNQQLMKQNQELRAEIAKIITSAHNLEQIGQKFQETLDNSLIQQNLHTPSQEENTSPIPPKLNDSGDQSINPEYIIEVDSEYLPSSVSKRSEINIFGLILAILFIIIGCTAASFLVAKFIIKNNHSSSN